MELTQHYLRNLLQDTSPFDVQEIAKDLEPCLTPVEWQEVALPWLLQCV